MKTEDLKALADMLHELGLSYKESIDLVSDVAKESQSVKRLWRSGEKSNLIKLGLALIAFPEPTLVSDVLGTFVLSVGVIQNRMRQSSLHIDDVYNTFRGAMKELQTIRRELSR